MAGLWHEAGINEAPGARICSQIEQSWQHSLLLAQRCFLQLFLISP